MDSAEKVCNRPEEEPGLRLCPRHHAVALRKLEQQKAKETARLAALERKWLAALPGWRAELATVEARIRRLDPPPPTTDMAAFMGVGSTAARRYRRRLTPERIHELSVLHKRRTELVKSIARADALLVAATDPLTDWTLEDLA